MSATIVKLTHKHAWGVGELQKAVDLLDDFRLGMLIATARKLALEVPKKTNATIHHIGKPKK